MDIQKCAGISNFLLGGTSQVKFKPCIIGPSRVLQIKNIATFELTNKYDTCCELYTDIFDICEQFGEVIDIIIPRPIWIEGMQK
jgi:hypothetical protein